jgi:hypothetical protein
MRITRDEQFSSYVKNLLIEDYKKTARAPDGKYHISELLQPRLAFFTRRDGKEMTEQDICMFIPGSAFHEYIQKRLGDVFAEKQIKFNDDIVGTVDWYGDYIVEIKTSRKWSVPDLPAEHYVGQVRKYMAIEGKLTGKILVIYFTAGRRWDGKSPSTLELESWSVEVTPEEQAQDLKYLEVTRTTLRNAENSGKFDKLPLCYDFCCFSEYKGKITKVCPFYGECQPDDRFNQGALDLWEELYDSGEQITNKDDLAEAHK